MKCQNCFDDFEEKDIQLSHDIPKYMGGTDADGRHNLCKDCHKKYELEVILFGLMNWITSQDENTKIMFRRSAKYVRAYFFKNTKKEDDNHTE